MSILSRTAADLFWMCRYLERADATARLVEMGTRMDVVHAGDGEAREEWRSVARAAGCGDFAGEARPEIVVGWLVADRSNPSSIVSCLDRARANGRSVRTALTTQAWETLNDAWLKLGDMTEPRVRRELPQVLDWVKGRCAQFRGAADATMLRDDRYDFAQLGRFIERADMTLRLLDVKHFALLPETEVVGGARDVHRWTSVLLATSLLRAYHWVYRSDYSPWHIVDFLLLNRACPRSYAHCYDELVATLDRLALAYATRHPCHATAADTLNGLAAANVTQIFQDGLRRFLADAIHRNHRLADEIADAYHF